MSTTLMTEPAAGWYHDPSDSGAWRWWDGTSWTDHIRAKEETPVSAPIPVVPESTISGPLPVQPASGPVTIQAASAPAPVAVEPEALVPVEAAEFPADAPDPIVVQPVPTHAPNFDDFSPAPAAAETAPEAEPEAAPEPESSEPAGPETVAGIPQPGEVAASPSRQAPLPNYAATPVTDQMYWHSAAAEMVEVPRLTASSRVTRTSQRGPVPSYIRDWNDLGSPNTPGIWLLALSPVLNFGLFLALLTALGSTPLPIRAVLGGAQIGVTLMTWVFAALDTRSLAARGYHAPRLAWMLLFPPLAYFIARGKAVRRESKAAWGPELVYILSWVGLFVVVTGVVLLLPAVLAPILSAVR